VSQRIETLEVTVPLKANQSVVNALTATVTQQGNDITLQGAAITSIQSTLTGKADQSALNALATTVSQQGNDITAQGTAITSLQSALNGYTGADAVATAFSGLNSQVSSIGGQVSAQADALTSLSAATTPGNVATANLRMTASAGPAGYAARIGFEARAGGSGAYRSAALFLDVPSGAGPTRMAAVADQFIFTDGTAAYSPVVISGGQLLAADLKVQRANIINFTATWAEIETAVVNNFVAAEANIGNLTVDTIKIKNGAVGAKASASGSANGSPSAWVTVCSATINNASGLIPLMQVKVTVNVSAVGSQNPGLGSARLVRSGNESNHLYDFSVNVNGGSSAAGSDVAFRMDPDAPTGSITYLVQVRHSGGASSSSATADLAISYNKK
jgi:hypothetical protein